MFVLTHAFRAQMPLATLLGLLGLLILVEPVGAAKKGAKVYELDVRVHKDVQRLGKKEVKKVLKTASQLLQPCNVKFKLRSIKTFGSPAPDQVTDADSLEAVQDVEGDVKVVESITRCRPGRNDNSTINGCAWRVKGRPRTVIITRSAIGNATILAHEFGHTKGLSHRKNKDALMFCRPGFMSAATLTAHECKCFREGCPIPDPEPNVRCPRER